MIRDRQIPIIDVGLVSALRAGRVEVVAATGFRPSLEPLVGHLGVLDQRGLPRAHGEAQLPGSPGLHFVGYSNPPTGNLREMSIDARRIARRLARD